MRILVVEDEVKAADYLRKGLSESGYAVEVAHNGIDGQFLAQESEFDLVILDVMLPGLDGWQLLQIIRRKSQVPVLFLTARDAVEDRVKGLELGADDYLVKPFSYAELLARVRTLLRRGPPRETEHFEVADLQLDLLKRKVTRSGERLNLTNKEFALLHLLHALAQPAAHAHAGFSPDAAEFRRLPQLRLAQPGQQAHGVPAVHQPPDPARAQRTRQGRHGL